MNFTPILLVLSTGFSTGALILAYAFAKRVALYTEPARKVVELELELADLSHAHEQLKLSHKRLNARVGMAAARKKAAEMPDDDDDDTQQPSRSDASTAMLPGETPQQWKARMREALAKRRLLGG